MKTYNSITHILSLACAGLIAAYAANQAGAAPNSGHLLVDRVANFGSDLGLVVSIDGKDVGTFSEGRKYHGDLSLKYTKAGMLPERTTAARSYAI